MAVIAEKLVSQRDIVENGNSTNIASTANSEYSMVV
jgi:hypothetical protein